MPLTSKPQFLAGTSLRVQNALCRRSSSLRGRGLRSVVVNRLAVLTREKGKNGKLSKALETKGIDCLEFPLIEHVPGPDLSSLSSVLAEGNFEWVTITSPEAADVFCRSWMEAGKPPVRVASVGKGTSQVLEKTNSGELDIAFTPTKSTATDMAQELPKLDDGNRRVLYPASGKARTDLQEGLSNRGFEVTRLNTYSTVPVENVADMDLQSALGADVVTFASPSAVKAWKSIVGDQWKAGPVACIGKTSAGAAKDVGFERVYFPEKPGLDGWVDSILQSLDELES